MKSSVKRICSYIVIIFFVAVSSAGCSAKTQNIPTRSKAQARYEKGSNRIYRRSDLNIRQTPVAKPTSKS